MSKHFSMLTIMFTVLSSFSLNALDAKQYAELCAQSQASPDAFKSQICNAYLGGAFDALGVINDKSRDEGKPLFCVKGQDLFDPEKVSQHIIKASKQNKFANTNAMWAVLDYVNKHNGCPN